MSQQEIENLIRTLTILTAAYEATDPAVVDSPSYTAGFRAGSKSAYADVICRLRDLRVEAVA